MIKEDEMSMTENKAINVLQINKPFTASKEANNAIDIANKALEEIQQYREIGTVEEFKALKEKKNKVIELPCEVNDTVFCILERRTRCTENDQEFDEYSCQGCECLECDSVKEKYISEQKAYTLEWIVSNRRKFGKTMFLTKEEAEKELANKT